MSWQNPGIHEIGTSKPGLVDNVCFNWVRIWDGDRLGHSTMLDSSGRAFRKKISNNILFRVIDNFNLLMKTVFHWTFLEIIQCQNQNTPTHRDFLKRLPTLFKTVLEGISSSMILSSWHWNISNIELFWKITDVGLKIMRHEIPSRKGS